VGAEVTKLVRHSQPSAKDYACQEILGQSKPNEGVHNIAWTLRLDDLPTGVTYATVTC
jgi:hypothetical protein